MGHRCNLVIIERGRLTVYYDHWAAGQIDEIVFYGPEIARRHIEANEPLKENGWLDDVWAEGGCVLNFDTKDLVWYGGHTLEYWPALHLAYRELLPRQWPGWTLKWARDGMFDIARASSIPLDYVRAYDDPGRRRPLLKPATLGDSKSGRYLAASGIVSLTSGPSVGYVPCDGALSHLGSELLSLAHIQTLVAEFSPEAYESWRAQAEDNDWTEIVWGAHFNLEARTIDVWDMSATAGIVDLIEENWPGWRVTHHEVDFRFQAQLVDCPDWPVQRADDANTILQEFRTHIQDDPTHNPVLSLVEKMTLKVRETIKVNPNAIEGRQPLSKDDRRKLDILDALEASLPPLPPFDPAD